MGLDVLSRRMVLKTFGRVSTGKHIILCYLLSRSKDLHCSLRRAIKCTIGLRVLPVKADNHDELSSTLHRGKLT